MVKQIGSRFFPFNSIISRKQNKKVKNIITVEEICDWQSVSKKLYAMMQTGEKGEILNNEDIHFTILHSLCILVYIY
jgi:hypothetical protein